MRIALVGNPNSGKTTLFNSLTGSNQRVGNWPGVTVEHKVGRLKADKSVEIIDLPGIYSLSPYTSEEEIARNYLIQQKPDIIINIVDGTNLERNLYLTSQLADINIPMIVALNMADILKKEGKQINLKKLEENISIPIVSISALTGENIDILATRAIAIANGSKQSNGKNEPRKIQFSKPIEECFSEITKIANLEQSPLLRWYQIKLFERDTKIQKALALTKSQIEEIDENVKAVELLEDDDAVCLIITQRYDVIVNYVKESIEARDYSKKSTSDRIDQIVTHPVLALPIFVVVMFLVYYISISTVGSLATDWTNDGLFGDGWFLFGKGRAAYEEKAEDYAESQTFVEAFEEKAAEEQLDPTKADDLTAEATFYNDEGEIDEVVPVNHADYIAALQVEEPDTKDFGPWIPGIPVLISNGLQAMNVSPWLEALIVDGIVAGVGAVLGFVPQMFVLFLLLAILEAIGYMSRIAFIMDRMFRHFGFSGKSFIPLMIGTGCSIPGIMAARTIENEKDRRMTAITTSFIPCGAKLPVIALISGAFFGGSGLITTACYFIGLGAVVVSGIILKKTKMFAGDVTPFVIELPDYRLPRVRDVLRSAIERSWSFVTKAAAVIMLTSILLWFLQAYGFNNGFYQVEDVNHSLLAQIGSAIGVLFAPLGFGGWKPAVATITGLIAKENIVGTFGVLYGASEVAENGWEIWRNMAADFTKVTAFSFLLFNLLCAPCFAAIGAIRREMASRKWTWFAIIYQTVLAYAVSFSVYQIANFLSVGTNWFGMAIAVAIIVLLLYLIFRPMPKRISAEK